MLTLKSIDDILAVIAELKAQSKSIGFVPTMGALHRGHLSLVDLAKSQCDICVASVYVNPAQFNDPSDLEKYPRTMEEDIYKLQKKGAHILFAPHDGEMLKRAEDVKFLLPKLPLFTEWEAAYRPGHFEGVLFIVHKLLSIIQPDTLVMGQKDFQQFVICRWMTRSFFPNLRMVMGVTAREENGLAMSSRNMRLAPEEIQKAAELYKSLLRISESKDLDKQCDIETSRLNEIEGVRVEYLSVAEINSLINSTVHVQSKRHVILGALYMGDVRLIDNIITDN